MAASVYMFEYFPVYSLNNSLNDISGWVSVEQKFASFYFGKIGVVLHASRMFACWSRWLILAQGFSPNKASIMCIHVLPKKFYVICRVKTF